MLSYRRETALQGTLISAKSGRLELRDNILTVFAPSGLVCSKISGTRGCPHKPFFLSGN